MLNKEVPEEKHHLIPKMVVPQYLEKIYNGTRNGGLVLGVRENGNKKLEGKIGKKGQHASQKINTFSDSKVNVNYDFATKHALTL